MSIDVYLNFNGNCREAVDFYAEVFGVEPTNLMTFGDMPPHPDYPLPDEAKNMIMHARLRIQGSTVMFSDVFPGMPFTQGNNVTLSIVSDNEEEIRSAFDKLKVGGKIAMELQETFWSKCYGSLRDKLGIEWQFNYGNGEVNA